MSFPSGSSSSLGGTPSDDFSADMALLNADDTPPSNVPAVVPPAGAPEGDEESTDLEIINEQETPLEVEEGEVPAEEEEFVPDTETDKAIVPIRRRPTMKDITTRFPRFFENFPDLRHIIYHEEEYRKIFPTIDDAKEAQSNAESFLHFSKLSMSGDRKDFTEFLKGVHEAKSLPTFVANFLPALYEMDRDLYFKVTIPVVASAIRNSYKAGLNSGDPAQSLSNSALHMALHLLGDAKYATGERMPEEIVTAKKDSSVEAERKQFYQERYQLNRTEILKTASTKLRADIKKGLDPNGVFTEFTANLLIKNIIEEVGEELSKNAQHMRVMNSLWKRAHDAGFAGNWKDRILSAYLSAARTAMPAIRTKIRAQALDDKKGQADRRATDAGKSANRKDVPGSSNTSGSRVDTGRTPKAGEIDWSKTSDMDILNGTPTLRK